MSFKALAMMMLKCLCLRTGQIPGLWVFLSIHSILVLQDVLCNCIQGPHFGHICHLDGILRCRKVASHGYAGIPGRKPTRDCGTCTRNSELKDYPKGCSFLLGSMFSTHQDSLLSDRRTVRFTQGYPLDASSSMGICSFLIIKAKLLFQGKCACQVPVLSLFAITIASSQAEKDP